MVTIAIIDRLFPRAIQALENLKSEHEGLSVITCNDETFMTLRGDGYDVRLAQELFDERDVSTLNSDAIRLIREEYLKGRNGRDLSNYGGYSLNDYAAMSLLKQTLSALRAVASINRMLSSTRVSRIVLIGAGVFTSAAEMVAITHRIECRSLYRDFVHRAIFSIQAIYRQWREGWPTSSFKHIVLEPLLTLLNLMDGMIRKVSLALRGRSNSKKKICFLSVSPWTHKYYLKLKKEGDWDLIMFGIDFFLRRRLFKGEPPIESFVKFADILRSVLCFIVFVCRSTKVVFGFVNRDSYVYEGVDMWHLMKPAVSGYMLLTLPRIYLEHLVSLRSMRGLDGHRVAVLSHMDCMHDQRTVVEAARKSDVGTLLAQHSLMGESLGMEKAYSDYIAAWGKWGRDWYSRGGYDPRRILFVGSDLYSRMSSAVINRTSKTKPSELGLDDDRITVLVVCAGGEGYSVSASNTEDMYMIESIVGAICKLGRSEDMQIAVKVHPAQNQFIFNKLIGALSTDGISIKIFTDRLEALLSLADVVVGTYTTAMLEAMFHKKPLISFDRLSKWVMVPYVDMGVALGASDEVEMENALGLLLDDESKERSALLAKQPEFIDYAISRMDESPVQKVVNLLKILADKKEMPSSSLP